MSGTRTREGWKISCFGPGCADLSGGTWLRAVAEKVGARSGGHVLANPEAWLTVATGGKAESVPSASARGALSDAPFDRWAGRLWSSEELARDALRWLMEERLISTEVIRRHNLGWNGTEILLPLLGRHGSVAGCKLRRPSRAHSTIAWPGLTPADGAFPLYPPIGRERRILLCEGELDALAALSVGIPACSVTMGAGTWLPAWSVALRDREVAICFDVGAEEIAEERAALLPTAWVVRLPGPDGYDVTDYLRDRSGARLQRLIKEAR